MALDTRSVRLNRLLRSTSLRLGLLHSLLFALSGAVLFAIVYFSTTWSNLRQLDDDIATDVELLVSQANASGVAGLRNTIRERTSGSEPIEGI